MQITEANLHHIIKQKHAKGAHVDPRKAPLPINDALNRLAESIQKRYNEKYVLHGAFIDEPDVHRFPVILKEYLDAANPLDLIGFSEKTAQLIAFEMGKKTTATSGFAKFLRYQTGNKDWLLVLMLKTSAQTGIDPKTLELNDSYVFDIQHLHEAARIDINKYLAGEDRYLTFVKPRAGKDDPSDYFRDALGCTDFTDSKHNTGAIIDALDAYSADQNWAPERSQAARKALYEYLKQKSDNKEPVLVESLSAILDDQNPKQFWEFVVDSDLEINSTFDPHPTTFRRLKRISHKFSNINLSFDVQDLEAGNIDIEDDNGTPKLIINNVPQKIIDEIRRAKGQ